jgi:putative membrane protein
MASPHSSPVLPPPAPRPTVTSTITHAARGALIGLVELVPGVSGGTVALVLGIFDRLIASANHFISGLTHLVFRGSRTSAARRFAPVEWSLVLPLAAGMFLALVTLSGPLHSFVENQATIASALFFGMVAASLLVPISMVRQVGPPTAAGTVKGVAVVLLVAAAAFMLLGIPALQIQDPPWWALTLSGAVAVCALALPGLSGSFILLTFGMYEPTLEAVSTRDYGYLALFIAGAVLGLASFVRLLGHLLRVRRRAVLLVATGLILGSLRALWPWQQDTTLLPPDDAWLWPLAACLAGACVVLLLWWRQPRPGMTAAVGPHGNVDRHP